MNKQQLKVLIKEVILSENTKSSYVVNVNDEFTDILYGGFYVVKDIKNNVVTLVNRDDGDIAEINMNTFKSHSGDHIDDEDYDFQFLRTKQKGKGIDYDRIKSNSDRITAIAKMIKNNIEKARRLTGVQHPTMFDFKGIPNNKIQEY